MCLIRLGAVCSYFPSSPAGPTLLFRKPYSSHLPLLSFAPRAATSESQKLHLLAVTADGRRVYFTTQYLRMPSYYGTYGLGTGAAAAANGAQQVCEASYYLSCNK